MGLVGRGGREQRRRCAKPLHWAAATPLLPALQPSLVGRFVELPRAMLALQSPPPGPFVELPLLHADRWERDRRGRTGEGEGEERISVEDEEGERGEDKKGVVREWEDNFGKKNIVGWFFYIFGSGAPNMPSAKISIVVDSPFKRSACKNVFIFPGNQYKTTLYGNQFSQACFYQVQLYIFVRTIIIGNVLACLQK